MYLLDTLSVEIAGYFSAGVKADDRNVDHRTIKNPVSVGPCIEDLSVLGDPLKNFAALWTANALSREKPYTNGMSFHRASSKFEPIAAKIAGLWNVVRVE